MPWITEPWHGTNSSVLLNVSLLLLWLHFALKRPVVLQASFQFPFCFSFCQTSSLPIPKTLTPLVYLLLHVSFLPDSPQWITVQAQTHTIPDRIPALAPTRRTPQSRRIERDACGANCDNAVCNHGFLLPLLSQRDGEDGGGWVKESLVDVVGKGWKPAQDNALPLSAVLTMTQRKNIELPLTDLMYLSSLTLMWYGRQRHRDGINTNPLPSPAFAFTEKRSQLCWLKISAEVENQLQC